MFKKKKPAGMANCVEINKRGFLYELKKNKSLFLMMTPSLIWFIVFAYLPMFGIVIAFKDINYAQGIFGSDWVGLKNFEYLVKSSDMWIITRNTLGYSIFGLVVGPICSIGVAMMLSELLNRKTAKVYQTLMFLPYFISWVVVSYIAYAFLSPDYGLVNSILKTFGAEAINWYMEPKYWPYFLMFLKIWKGLGYSSVVYLAAIMGIDNSYYEAAHIDGAGKFKQALYITLPFLKPMVIILTIMGVGSIFAGDFGLHYQVTKDSGALYPVTQIIDTYVFRSLKVTGDIGMSAAAGLYQSLIGFILVLATNFTVKKIDSDQALF